MEKFVKNILNEESSFELIKDSVNSIAEILYNLGKIKKATHSNGEFYLSKEGRLLEPELAANCIFDYVRTTKFIRGIKSAIDYYLKKTPNQKVQILYSGTGPFATLLLPLLPLYDSKSLEIVFVDVFEESTLILKKLIEELRLKEFVNSVITTDATKIEFESERKFDIIIIEAMQHALANEPQVALTLHLTKFLNDAGTFIPKQIKIDAYLTNIQSEYLPNGNKFTNFWNNIKRNNTIERRKYLGNIFTLDKTTAEKYVIENKKIQLAEINVSTRIGKMRDLILTTEIDVWNDIILSEEDDTGLTKIYHDINWEKITSNQKLKFEYSISNYPKVLVEYL